MSLSETTWIGLQVGTPQNVTVKIYSGTPGEKPKLRYKYVTGCYWPAGVRPRLATSDLCPENAVEKCSVTYNDTFHGQWEDGERYDKAESADFWAFGAPSDIPRINCGSDQIIVDEQSRAYCERGVDGQADTRAHCAQILPADEKQIKGDIFKLAAGKWTEYWCWMKIRAYICERPAERSDGSEDSTAPSITSGQVETSASATTASCIARIEACTSRARGRIDEIEREINAVRTGNREVIDKMALGGPDAGSTWIGGFVLHF
ncbi:hypothetical protein AAVH_25510 [Aphelenchoides avenae]|nr:hypothetical protein AAVH_25510 [Aphelenchus avenae]